MNITTNFDSSLPLFICGAGISVDPPASLPGTAAIVEMAKHILLPFETAAERYYSDLVSKIQPEVLFEQASFLITRKIQDIWDVLRAPDAEPNFYHYLIVLLAGAFKTPIITLNFDTLLEKAAQRCGLRPRVYVPGRVDLSSLVSSAPISSGDCVIWKLHGCMELYTDNGERSLQNTMSQLARPNWPVLDAIKDLISKAKLYIVGYSGRDADFFPELTKIIRSSRLHSAPCWIDPEFKKVPEQHTFSISMTIHKRCKLLGGHGRDNFKKVMAEDFPSFLHQAQAFEKTFSMAEKLSNDNPRSEVQRKLQQEIALTVLEKQAVLMCLLYHSGHTYEAYKYGRDKIQLFQQQLSPFLSSVVMVYFARVCDWNSRYDEFYKWATRARRISARASRKQRGSSNRAVHVAAASYVLRAWSMLLGPGMEWPKTELSYALSRRKKVRLAYMCIATELHIRGILAGFKDTFLQKMRAFVSPKPPLVTAQDSFPEVFAWQYYLDHKSVLLRYCMLQFKLSRQPDGSLAATNMLQRMLLRSLEQLEQQVQYIGAPHTLADSLLYQARYKLRQDLDFAQHLWSLINLPIGRALAFLDQGRDYMQEGKNGDAVLPFVFGHYISIMSGSHLAALKALIGLSHVGISVRESVWNFSVGMLQGREHTEFFQSRAEYMHLVARASLPVP